MNKINDFVLVMNVVSREKINDKVILQFMETRKLGIDESNYEKLLRFIFPYIEISSIDIIEFMLLDDKRNNYHYNTKIFDNNSEYELLSNFRDYLENLINRHYFPKFVTFRGLSFDIPLIVYKCYKHNIVLHSRFLDINKYRTTAHLDLYNILSLYNNISMSLDEVYYDFFGDINYDKVSQIEKIFKIYLRIEGLI